MNGSGSSGLSFECPKCGNTGHEIGEFRGAGGFLGKLFDVQTQKFSTVVCTQCRYTEFYRADSSALGNLFDFFTQ